MSVNIDGQGSHADDNSLAAVGVAIVAILVGALFALAYAAYGIVYGILSAGYASWALVSAIFTSLGSPIGVIELFSLQAICGLLAGLLIGYARTVLRIRSRLAESALSASFATKIITDFLSFVQDYRAFFPQMLVSTLVGYVVGIVMQASGVPHFFSHQLVGAAMVYTTSGDGGGKAFIGFSLFFLLLIVGTAMGVAAGLCFKILISILVAAIGGGIKGTTKQIGITLSGPNAAQIGKKEPLPTLGTTIREGSITGFISGGATAVLFALNAAGLNLFYAAFIFLVSVRPLLAEVRKLLVTEF